MTSTPSRKVILKLEMPTQKVANIVVKALQPEITASQPLNSNVQIKVTGKFIQLSFTTNRTSTMRAYVNSYLRWIKMVTNSLKTLDL